MCSSDLCRPERMKAASGAPAQEDREVAGVGFPGSRRELGLQEDVDEVGDLLIGGDGDRIGGHTIRIRRRGLLPTCVPNHHSGQYKADAGAATAHRLYDATRYPAVPVARSVRYSRARANWTWPTTARG